VPNQQALVAFVNQGLTRLEAAFIKQVKLYGRQIGESFQLGVRTLNWQHNRCLWSYHSHLLEPSRQCRSDHRPDEPFYNLKALLLSAAFKDGCPSNPAGICSSADQQALVAFVNQGLTRLEAASIKQVKLTDGRQARSFQLESGI